MRMLGALLFSTSVFVSGCGNFPPLTSSRIADPATPGMGFLSSSRSSSLSDARPIKITALGYGAASAYERYTEGQKKLMAMRASKLDAYRAIAEQVYGVRVTGGSTVAAMIAKDDGFRVSIDAYIRGARVVEVKHVADGSYETSMEMDFDEEAFQAFLAQSLARQNSATESKSSNKIRGAVGPGTQYGSNFYYSE